jgi:hypothetical protein
VAGIAGRRSIEELEYHNVLTGRVAVRIGYKDGRAGKLRRKHQEYSRFAKRALGGAARDARAKRGGRRDSGCPLLHQLGGEESISPDTESLST